MVKNYRVNSIFYSLQGEGYNTGRAAVFIRFAGCNLRCPFCDTDFDSFREYTAEAIIEAIATCESHFVVLTGGEPTLQVDEAFVDLLHSHGYEVAMESNGTRPAPRNLDWLTISPKSAEKSEMNCEKWLRKPDELKIIFDEQTDPEAILSALYAQFPSPAPHLFLQPCDTGDADRNRRITAACTEYIKHHPEWRLSLQTHKLIGIE